MNIKKRGLGKGLSDLGLGALLGDLQSAPTAVAELEAGASTSFSDHSEPLDGQLKKLSIDALKPGKYQPRKIMASDALEELANSIRTQGIIQPIVVRPLSNNQYEIIAGERRWRAAKLAGLMLIPAIIREMNDETAMVMALIENIQRRDLNVIEEASALNRLMTEFTMTHQQVADAVGKSRTNITNMLRLLKLNFDVRILVEKGDIEMGHARALLTLSEEQQSEVANIIVIRKLSVRETEAIIRKLADNSRESMSETLSQKMTMHSVEDRLMQKLGVKVTVTQNAKGRGKLIIQYRNEKELENLLSKMG